MDPNTWYFSLSALAQTLAAVMGLNAIFVALKLEHILKEIDYYKRRGATILKIERSNGRIRYDASHILSRLREFDHNHREDDSVLPHLCKTLRKYESTERATAEHAMRFVEDTIYSLEDYINQKRRIIEEMKGPVILTIVVIILSMFFLSLTDPMIAAVPEALFDILVVITGLGALSIWMTAYASYRIFLSVE